MFMVKNTEHKVTESLKREGRYPISWTFCRAQTDGEMEKIKDLIDDEKKRLAEKGIAGTIEEHKT